MLLTKKSINKLGTQMNENAGSKPSNFAMKQMEKMGWTEGKGLGKTESGISKHLTITKRDDSAGLGSEAVEARANEATETWWHDAFASNLKLLQNKAKSKKSKSGDSKKRKSGDEDIESHNEIQPSYDDLFKATGGARLGMRARADQKGKLKRTEDQMTSKIETDSALQVTAVSVAPPVGAGVAEALTTSSADSDSSDVAEQQPKKKAKKAKSEKSDKKDKSDDDKEVKMISDNKKEKKEKKAKKDKKSKSN